MGRARWAVLAAAACLVVAAVAVAYAAGQVKAAKVLAADVVRAKRFELVDEKGRVRVVLSTELLGDHGKSFGWRGANFPGLSLYDENGREGVALSVRPDGGGVLNLDQKGESRANLNVLADGSPCLSLRNDSGKEQAVLTVEPDGKARLYLADGEETARVNLMVLPDGRPGMTLLEQHARPVPCAVETIEHVGGGGIRCMLAEIFLPRAG